MTDEKTLRRVYDFGDLIVNYTVHSDTLYTWKFWKNQLHANPQLLLYSEDTGGVVGAVWGWVEPNNNVTVGMVAVDEKHRRQGFGKRLMNELVKQVKESGRHTIALGALEESEDFYIKCGFSPNLFLQSKKHTLDELRALNTEYKEIWGLESDENGWCKLMLKTPAIDHALQQKYDETFDDCVPQTIFLMNV